MTIWVSKPESLASHNLLPNGTASLCVCMGCQGCRGFVDGVTLRWMGGLGGEGGVAVVRRRLLIFDAGSSSRTRPSAAPCPVGGRATPRESNFLAPAADYSAPSAGRISFSFLFLFPFFCCCCCCSSLHCFSVSSPLFFVFPPSFSSFLCASSFFSDPLVCFFMNWCPD